MKKVILLLFLLPVVAIAQKKVQHYIFDVSLGFKSLTYTGVKDLNVDASYDYSYGIYAMMYTEESWVVDYNLHASQGINFGLGVNIVQRPSYQLKVNGGVGYGRFNSSNSLERTSHNNQLTDYALTQFDFEFINSQTGGEVTHSGTEFTAQIDMAHQIRVFNNFWIGPVLGWHRLERQSDVPEIVSGYVPYYVHRQRGTIRTHQLFGGVEFSQKVKQFSFNLSITQAFITTDKVKTVSGWSLDPEKSPSSTNIDYRFPTIIEVGVSFSFFRQKNGCGTCPNW